MILEGFREVARKLHFRTLAGDESMRDVFDRVGREEEKVHQPTDLGARPLPLREQQINRLSVADPSERPLLAVALDAGPSMLGAEVEDPVLLELRVDEDVRVRDVECG